MNIITKPDCHPCTTLKNMLKKLNVDFNEYTLDDIPENIREIILSNKDFGYPAVLKGYTFAFAGLPGGGINGLKKELEDRGMLKKKEKKDEKRK